MPKQPNMNQMMRQVQQMQADMAKAQEELKHASVEASAGGGMVTVKVSGELEILELRIDPGGGRPGGRRAAAGHGPGGHERGAALGSGDGGEEDGRRDRWAGGPAATWAFQGCRRVPSKPCSHHPSTA